MALISSCRNGSLSPPNACSTTASARANTLPCQGASKASSPFRRGTPRSEVFMACSQAGHVRLGHPLGPRRALRQYQVTHLGGGVPYPDIGVFGQLTAHLGEQRPW